MKMILSTARDIRRTIHSILNDARADRIVLVAYVGASIIKYLPHPKGIRLYCWAQAPGTNPQGLKQLLKAQVDLYSVPYLHMKLYWSSKHGSVLGSANLSEAALADNRHHELAVYLPPGALDANAILKQLVATKINPSFIKKYQAKYDQYLSRISDLIERRSQKKLPHAQKRSRAQVIAGIKKAFKKYGIKIDAPKRLTIRGKRFCFTGKCEYGTRLECNKAVESKGGKYESYGVTQATDVLVIGKMGSPNYRFDYHWKKYGHKYRKAMEYKKTNNGRPLIIPEDIFIKALKH